MSASPGRPKKRSRPLGGTARSARVPQSAIVIVDTSVLLNIMDVPDRNQHNPAVLDRLGALIDAGDHLFIPMAANSRGRQAHRSGEKLRAAPGGG